MKHWLITVLVSGGFAAQGLVAQVPAPAPVPPVPPVAPAVPAPHAMPVVISNSNTSGSFLGVGIKEIDSDRAKALKLKEEAGVEITRVDENSPAEKAGLRAGDVILEYNGQQVEGIDQFSRMVHETPAGREVKLGVFRNGANQTILAKIGSRRPTPMPFDMGNLSVRIPDIPHTFLGWRSSLLGVEAESLEGQFAEFFGVKEGVLVRSVIQGSAAEKAGMKAGDVITRVDDSKVASSSDVTSRLRSYRGKSVPVVVLRDHKEVTVQVSVPGDDRSEERLYARPLGHPALL
jgi:serine protease Do